MTSASHNQYPAPVAKYEDVVADRKLFMNTLEQLHATMGTKFMIPIIGGRELDLHKLFVEVTSRGGIEKIITEKRWKEVTSTFSFPSTATNASFVLRKYYYSLLQQYEGIYYFRAQPVGVMQNIITTPVSRGLGRMATASSSAQPANAQQPSANTAGVASGVPGAPSVGFSVVGVIDGKFDSGYLVTVTIGKEKLKGVLYQTPAATATAAAGNNQVPQTSSLSTGKANSTPATSGVHRKRRRRRKKSEMKKRDPAQPKPNRSGYNFFFAEQHARLKALHPDKDRDISRMIGELWNNLEDNEKAVYQEKAVKDKERYRKEMEEYKERLRTNQVISDAVPIQQRFPVYNVAAMVDLNTTDGIERDSPENGGIERDSPENGSDSSKSETNEEEDEEEDVYDTETLLAEDGTGVESGNAGFVETSTAAAAATAITADFQVITAEEKSACEESEGSLEAGSFHHEEAKQDSAPDAEHDICTTTTMTK